MKYSDDPVEQEFLLECVGMTWAEGEEMVEKVMSEMTAGMTGPNAWEPVRQIVQAPDGRLWLLAQGRVARLLHLDEIGKWASYVDHKPVSTPGGALVFHPPSEYAGPHWEIHRVTWDQMKKLARCTCEGVKPEGEHYALCCLVTVLVGTGGKPDCTCGGIVAEASGEVVGHTAGCLLGDAELAAAVKAEGEKGSGAA